jgi:hypothetical protein
MQRENLLEPLEPIESEEQIERPLEAPQVKRKPAWCREILHEAERHGAPSGTFRERKRPHKYSGYVANMEQINNVEPTNFEDAAKQQVWRDAMMEEFQSIIKNDVWEVVPRPEGKSIVTSRWIYKIKHAADGSVENTKRDLWLAGSRKRKVLTMRKLSLQ